MMFGSCFIAGSFIRILRSGSALPAPQAATAELAAVGFRLIAAFKSRPSTPIVEK